MRLTSHGTGGARRRLRQHSERHRPLTWRGTFGPDLVFELHATDGRTYALKLDDADVAEVLRAAEAKREREARKRAAADGGDDCTARRELEQAGQGRLVT